MSILTECIRADAEYKHLLMSVLEQRKAKTPLPIMIAGLCEGATDAAYAALCEDITAKKKGSAPILLVCSEEKECVRICGMLRKFGARAEFYMTRDLNFYNIVASHEYEYERLKVLSAILHGKLDVVVTTPDAALSYTMPPAEFISSVINLEFDKTVLEIEELERMLLGAGYIRAEMVDAPGQFAKRGGIVDIYPPYAEFTDIDGEKLFGAYPIRIELFGDELDRMEIFDPATQRMTATLSSVEIAPAREILLTPDKKKELRDAIEAQWKRTKDERAKLEMISELAAIDGGLDLNFIDKYISLIYPEKICMLDYLVDLPCVLMRNTASCSERLKASAWHLEQTVRELIENGTIAPRYTDYSKPVSAFEVFCEKNPVLHFDSFGQGMSGKKLGAMFTFRTKHMVTYGDNYGLLCEDIDGYVKTKYKVLLLAENESSAKNLCGYLCDRGFRAMIEAEIGDFTLRELPVGTILIVYKQAIRGFELSAVKTVILSTNSESRDMTAGASGKLRTSKKKKSAAERIMSYNDLAVGDFVVHEVHGIGQYMGIENITVDGVRSDYITIRYAGSDKLFLPADKLDSISKYIGAHADDGLVKLSRFGGGEWERSKARAKAAVKEMAKELIKLYAERLRRPGFAFPEDDEIQRDFEAAFGYDETDGQLEAIEEIKKDMMSPVPMDRLLCGDVGFGKTEVALRAAYKAVLGGKQVAILVPTTILALQHYQTVLSRTRGFMVNVDMISRFRTPKQQAQTLRKLKRGEVDIIIGTHRLISKDIEFKDLGLLIVDEEQRFGVAQKEKLKQMAGNVDVLTLSATPIPRTLNMAMGGIRDMSVLDEAPGDRLPVQTYVLEHDDMIVTEAIRRELRRGGQVFYLYNFVDSIDRRAAQLAKEIPEARITVAHGKMDKEQLEDIWGEMLSGEIDILVCTTIIETGVDIPNANTLIVENSQRLGLSQLHQIRGRVGRSSRRAYAYFTFPRDKAVSEVATKRLEAIREYAEFGAGFKIALRDLEIRGAGNILGAEQHGHLDAIGYDLYIKLLNEAVLEERGEKIEKKVDTTLSLKCDAFIPEKYVEYSSQRMELYKKIAAIETPADKDDILDEMIDRFGDIPAPVQNLLTVALVRAMAIKCGIVSVVEDGSEIKIYPSEFDVDIWSELADDYRGRMGIILTDNPGVKLRKQNGENTPKVLYSLFCKCRELQEAKKASKDEDKV